MDFHPRSIGLVCRAPNAGRPLVAGHAWHPLPARHRTSDASAPVEAGAATRLDRIRERVRSGFYASPAAVDALARCLLASGAV